MDCHYRFRALLFSFLAFHPVASVPDSEAEIVWSRIPDIAKHSFTKAGGPTETFNPEETSLPESDPDSDPDNENSALPGPLVPSITSSTIMPPQLPPDGPPQLPFPATIVGTLVSTPSYSAAAESSQTPFPQSSPSDGLAPSSTVGPISASPSSVDSGSFGPTSFPVIGTTVESIGTSTGFATSFSAVSTGQPLASSSMSSANGASTEEAEPSPVPGPILKEQNVLGIAIGIGAWLIIIIAVLSFLLWRKRKKGGVVRLSDDSEVIAPTVDFLGEGEMAMAAPPVRKRSPSQTRPRSQQRGLSRAALGDEVSPATPVVLPPHRSSSPLPPISEKAPSIPAPFFSRAPPTMGEDFQPPLQSHPVSRDGGNAPSLVTLDHTNVGAQVQESIVPMRNNLRGNYTISESSEGTLPGDISSKAPSRSSSVKSMKANVKMTSWSQDDPVPLSSNDHVAELPPSLGKLNMWLEENRRRSRMAGISETNTTGPQVGLWTPRRGTVRNATSFDNE